MTQAKTSAQLPLTVRSLTKTYAGKQVLKSVDFQLLPGKIYGLLGRNGAGKTTLLSTLLGLVRPDAGGQVLLFGQEKLSSDVLAASHFMPSRQTYAEGMKVSQVLKAASLAYPNWDEELAQKILEFAAISPRAKANKLSDGQKSWLGIALALASRAPLTIMDEPYTGLDPLARELFYDLLLKDFSLYPRTFLISTHLVDELAPLLDSVLLLDRGRLVLCAEADQIPYRAHEIAGSADAVSVYLAQNSLEKQVRRQRSVGSLRTALIAADLTQKRQECAQNLGLEVEPISLKDALATFISEDFDSLQEAEA